MNKIILFYKYVYLENPQDIKKTQEEICRSLGLKGRIILAHEGINGTLGGTDQALAHYIAFMNNSHEFKNIDFKESSAQSDDFPRLMIKVKSEIVNLGLNPQAITPQQGGQHLTPAQAHELLKNKPNDLIILDGRNNYESRVGAFEGAIKPDIRYFRDFPEYIDQHLELFKDKEVLMYCTGGIRCERASAYLKSKKITKNIYQITGGIHRYAEEFPDGFFKGKNYVFDGRTTMKITDDILSNCDNCQKPWDEYSNCPNASCNKQTILCPECSIMLEKACSSSCRDLLQAGAAHRRPTRYRTTSCSL